MSATPGEIPAFDFGNYTVDTFDAETIAEDAIWPLIDELFGHDWRADAEYPDNDHFTRRGIYKGVEHRVVISADCSPVDDSDDRRVLDHSAYLTIEKKATGVDRILLLDQCKTIADENEDDEVLESTWEQMELDEAKFEIWQAEKFDFYEADSSIENWVVIQGPFTRVNISRTICEDGSLSGSANIEALQEFEEAEESDDPEEGEIYGHHLDSIIGGFTILCASKSLIKELENIKNHPCEE